MKLSFKGDLTELAAGIQILGKELGFETAAAGIPVKVENTPGKIEVILKKNNGVIRYDKKIHFFRALGLFVEALRRNDRFEIIEEPQFSMNGPMFDVSRNAVLTVESIKKIIRIMALMGLNMMMLYTEDTYTIVSRPYFGYMRGRYSYDELKECDDYAEAFGIEIIPCIQTLAHLQQTLKWDCAKEIKDNEDILLAGDERTYEFIEEMIKSASSPFRSKRIHIGMDEAYNLGLGKYLSKNGYRRRFDIMNDHLGRVIEITSRFGLKPMMWSDMYFRLGAKSGTYYDLEGSIPDDVIESVPREVQLVYWDYYHSDEGFYLEYIRRHKRFGSKPVFAGGIWTWEGFCTKYGKTFSTTNSALSVCKKEGITEVIATLWGDDGAENNYFSALLGLQLYAEHGYAKVLDMDKLKRRFSFCTGGELEAFMDLAFMDETPGSSGENVGIIFPCNPSKYLLWQDILLGLFDRHIRGLDLSKHYTSLGEKMKCYSASGSEWDFVFNVPEKLCSVLSIKSEIGLRLKEYYDNNDMDGLREIIRELSELSKRIHELKNAHRDQWYKTYKPFGWEVLDIRYGGIAARIDTAARRVEDYVQGKIKRIEELEEERLYFDCREDQGDAVLCQCGQYRRIVTAGAI